MLTGKKYWRLIAALAIALCAALGLSLFCGAAAITPLEALSALRDYAAGSRDNLAAIVFLEIRLPRAVLAAASGAALAVSGAAFQGFFRNALADPYITGSSSGSALGAAAAMTAGFTLSGTPVSAVALAAFAGSLAAVFLVFAIARSAGNPPPAAALLLAGVSVSAFFSALLSMMLVVKDRDLYRVYYWLLGSFAGTGWDIVISVLPIMALGTILVAKEARNLDILLQGDEAAQSLGVHTSRTRLVVAMGASLVCAAAVSAAGIIGFVGLIAPHAMRLAAGPVHKRLLPASALAGAVLLSAADILARVLIPPAEIPIGIICSLAGCPFFLYLLAKNGRGMGKM